MAGPINVLVVDDAVVVRRMVSDVLDGDPDIHVAGTAANGRIALQKVKQSCPDIVTLDVEMPEMDGLETVRELRKAFPRLPVIMFSTLTTRGAAATLDALAHGASDYVAKPANVGSVSEAQNRIREQLIPKIKTLCGRPTSTYMPLPKPQVVLKAHAPAAVTLPPDAVVIGVSTGGPNALAEVIPALPRDLAVPVAIVQHMPPVFTRTLAERLNASSQVTVVEAEHGMVLKPGWVYIAPGGYHMTVQRDGVRVVALLNQQPPENFCRPSVDVLFRSAAAVYGSRLLGVILTGMGKDGLEGTDAIVARDGHVLAQDEASSVVWGMPGFVARAGLADAVLPLGLVAQEVARRCATRAPMTIGGRA